MARIPVIAFLLMVGHAQAADAAATPLSCAGLNGAPNDSLVVDIAGRTVTMQRTGIMAHINHVDDVSISFVGDGPAPDNNPAGRLFVAGSINRLTGDLEVRTYTWWQGGQTGPDNDNHLVCKVTNRLF
jgi:hypothetical protein